MRNMDNSSAGLGVGSAWAQSEFLNGMGRCSRQRQGELCEYVHVVVLEGIQLRT